MNVIELLLLVFLANVGMRIGFYLALTPITLPQLVVICFLIKVIFNGITA